MDDKITNAAEEAKARDAAALDVTEPVTEDPLLDIPDWLRRALPPEKQQEAWERYCYEHGIDLTRARAPAPGEESRKIFEPAAEDLHPDLRAISQAEKDRVRIAKMKAGIAKRKAVASGETQTMPLSGKDALAKIRGEP